MTRAIVDAPMRLAVRVLQSSYERASTSVQDYVASRTVVPAKVRDCTYEQNIETKTPVSVEHRSVTMRKTLASCMGFLMLCVGATNAQAAMVSIADGVAMGIAAGNAVLAAAGITQGDGQLFIGATVALPNDGTVLSLYDVGSDTSRQTVIKLHNTAGPTLIDATDFRRGTDVNEPWQYAGSVTQDAGELLLSFNRRPGGPGSGNAQAGWPGSDTLAFARIAYAYLDDANRITATPTDRILVLLDDKFDGPDADFDDYVAVLQVKVVPLPSSGALLCSGLAGCAWLLRRRKSAPARGRR